MRTPPINHAQAKALAKFLHELRPDWDVPGIEHFLGQARHLADAADVAVAAIRAATVAGNRTPAVIAMDGAHWRTPEVAAPPTRRPPARDELCRECSKDQTTCDALWTKLGHVHGHRFTPLSTPPQVDVATGELRDRFDPSDLIAELRAGLRARTSTPGPAAPRSDTPTPTPEPATTTQGATA